MVSKSHAKRRQDIKTKLMAAIAMLLVSSIMMVSSTYAWFTLSTAPEVTGISTQVGANGNLEMALLPADAITGGSAKDGNFGITSGSGDSMLSDDLRNVTWGNLVDVSNNTFYGLDKISLYPSALNVTSGTLAASMLRTPEYGSDGRVANLAEKTVTGIYDGVNGFPQNSDAWGVRAVGVSSAMTPRQLAYRNAISAANTSMSMAKSLATSSLNLNGSTLANIAVTHATTGAAHTAEEITSLRSIVSSLTGTAEGVDGIIEHIESAYKNYVLAWVASNANSAITDEQFTLVQAWIEAKDIYTIAGSTTVDLGGGNTVTLTVPDAVKTPVNALATTKTNVTSASGMLDNLYTDNEGKYPWLGSGEQKGVGDVLSILAEISAMKVNGIEVSKVKDPESISKLMKDVSSGNGVTVTMATGGGVYADIADHCGDYNASIVMDINYNGLLLEDMTARMATASTLSPNHNYLVVMGSQFGSGKFDAPSGGGEGSDMPITEYYGYVIDLAFRTNAAESNLLLQTEAVNRIYDENGSEETLGHGSTMTFTSTTPDFTAGQLAGLMEAIRVVFFDPTNNNVYAYAKLDMDEGKYTVTGGNTITAKLYIYETTAEIYNPVPADTAFVSTETYYTKDGETYKKAEGLTEFATGVTYYTKTEASENLLNGTDAQQVITALNQNTAKAVSVLVYLDGENIENADVAATAATSMTGTMNLQFASSANLVPMNYAPLMNQGGTATNPDDPNKEQGSN